MDNSIVYKIITPAGALLICKCKSEYFYLLKPINSILVRFYNAKCTNCEFIIYAYGTDELISIGEVTWITV